ncbi:MAG: protein-disulfide reductase DsbD family protein [Bdellovibrionales bacterium]|nr:protein-disulfide reductase DsbD family protein [Bdellovibrionales bacterium]
MSVFIRIFFFILTICSFPEAEAQNQIHLISPYTHVKPDESFPIGVWIQLKPGWHTYWKHAGSVGVSPKIHFDLPDGVSLKHLPWPIPKRLSLKTEKNSLYSFIYDNEVLLPFEVTVSQGYSHLELPIRLNMEWAVCKEVCSIKKDSYLLTLTMDNSFKFHSKNQQLFHQIKLNPSSDLLKSEFIRQNQSLILNFKFKNPVECLDVFPKNHEDFTEDPPQVLKAETRSCSFQVKSSSSLLHKVSGLITYKKQDQILSAEFTALERKLFGLALFALFAFLGGLLLNFMPCVLPIIFLKLYNTLELIEKSPKKILWLNITYSAGVIISFWILAFSILAFKSAGQAVGWGFHLQSPLFVTLLALLFTLIGFYLLNLFTLPLPKAVLNVKGEKFFDHFITGVLSTTAASPCTVPFMASAVGFAFSRSYLEIFVIFSFLGLGLSSPYLFISFVPHWFQKLPPPGRKMQLIKSVLAFPLFIVTVWLMYLLSFQLSTRSFFLTLMIFPFIGLYIWSAKSLNRSIVKNIALGLMSLLIAVLIAFQEKRPSLSEKAAEQTLSLSNPSSWKKFSLKQISEDRSRGHNVLVALGAEWCLTCKTNEQVFKNEKIKDFLKSNKVQLYYGDWTNGGREITEFLKSYNSWGVPFYVFYRGKEKTVLLPEILLPAPLLKKLQSALKKSP